MHLSVSLLCILLVAISLGAPAARSFAADDEKPSIFINSGSFLGFILGTNVGLSRFSAIAKAKGFYIDHGVHSDLVTGSPLDGIDVYIMFEPNFPFLDADRIALRQWIRNGGILISADWAFKRMSSFTREFGFESDVIIGEGAFSLNIPDDSPLAEPLKITNLRTKGGFTMKIADPTKAESILKYDTGQNAMVRTISHAGRGEIIGIGSWLTILDDGISGEIKVAENDKLAQNLLSYIYRKLKGVSAEGYDLNLFKLKTKGGGSFVPGEEIKFVAKIRNVGAQAGEATRIAFYIEESGLAPSARIEVASATVAAIGAKKKIKIVKKAFLPDGLAAGTYEVTAVIDPEEASDDSNTGNNGAAAKKKIVIQ